MKKTIYAIVLIVMIFMFCGCPDKNKSNQDDKVEVKSKIDKKAAKEFMDNYLRTVTTGDINALDSFYSSNLKSEMKSAVKVLNPHITGYKIEAEVGMEEGSDESEGGSEKSSGDDGKEDTVEYTVHIFNAYTGFPYSSDDSVLYTIKIENKKMVIDKKKITSTVDVYSLNNAIYKRSEGKVKGEYVLSIIDMPEFAIPQSALPLEVKFNVPRDAFGPCVLAPDGSSIAISSIGTNSFAAIVKIEEKGKSSSEESKAAIGGDEDSGASSLKTSGGGNKETGKTGEESKLNTKLKPVDLYVESKICNFAFSPDGKTLAVETIPDYGNNKIYLYKAKEQEIINAGIDKQFKPDRFKVMSPCFLSENEIEFKVSAVKSATTDELRYNGFWIFNIKTKKFKQL
jgi:hypothetical protein